MKSARKLKPRNALAGLDLPLELSGIMLEEIENPSAISISPFNGQGMAVAAGLKKALKLDLPKVGKVTSGKSAKILWSGHGQWTAVGEIDFTLLYKELDSHAAVVNQSDAIVGIRITGEDSAALLSRLSPLDFNSMAIGDAAVSEFVHVAGIIVPVKDGFEAYISRSSARWALNKVVKTMYRLEAQNAL